ncbi:MAG: hypothetical protein AAGH78_15125 [Cyanobacteria bacterium P01_H01_bin.58]
MPQPGCLSASTKLWFINSEIRFLGRIPLSRLDRHNATALYDTMNVPEFWRYNGKVWRIYLLRNGDYQEVDASPTFPQVLRVKLYEFLAAARQDEVAAEIDLRQWAQSIL